MIYTAEQAKKYRECDDNPDDTVKHFGSVVKNFCDRDETVVIDLGCGTGRYFRCVPKHHDLIGVDCSPLMLAEAKTPAGGREAEHLVCANVINDYLYAGAAGVVFSIGVLAEHISLTNEMLDMMQEWLLPSGIVYFTAEKTKEGKANTISEKALKSLMEGSKFEKWSISEWDSDTEHFKGTHFEVIAE